MTQEGNEALVLVELSLNSARRLHAQNSLILRFEATPAMPRKTTRTACVSSTTSLTPFVTSVNAQWLAGTIFLAAHCATGSAKKTTSVASPATSARIQENEVPPIRFLLQSI
uniref:AlNc14C865G12587 protein n=1 Tax=Albugo laibachii Nc14 TaxID=890382 RepID=F0X269_9STRA|nr:AlNc14C865G12587 [Albugo laibachii Nc14]|eukprot:CCA27944.1 AlNc14C865G12587 [Albugo laibachii Nc14]